MIQIFLSQNVASPNWDHTVFAALPFLISAFLYKLMNPGLAVKLMSAYSVRIK